MTPLLFGLIAFVIAILFFALLRFWQNYTRRSPEDELFEREMGLLNDEQANRVSDQRLAKPLDIDESWRIMVQRGGGTGPQRKRRPQSTTRRRPDR